MPNHFYDKFIIRKKPSKLDLDIMKKKKKRGISKLKQILQFFLECHR